MAGRGRGRYPPEYKKQIVELVRAGRSPGSRARPRSAIGMIPAGRGSSAPIGPANPFLQQGWGEGMRRKVLWA